MDAHRLAEERSIALHRAVADALRREPSHLQVVRQRLHRWREEGRVHPHYADEWSALIEGPFEDLLRMLVDEGDRARALRQSTPFVGIIDPRTRWRIWREVRERTGKSA
jgi:hypothetical protein